MEQILQFIVKNMSFLWSDYKYRITHSDVANHMGGWAEVYVESESLRLIFTFERSQLLLEVVSLFDEERSRNPIELVCDFLGAEPALTDGRGPATPFQRGAYSDFLRTNFTTIEEMYSEANWNQTVVALNDFVKLRHGRKLGES